MAKRTRARRGHPKGKAYGFRGLKPAAKTRSAGTKSASSASTPSTSSASTPSTSSS